MKMGKLILGAGLLAMGFAHSAMAQPRVVVDDAVVGEGTPSVSITVVYDGNADGVAAQFNVVYDNTKLTADISSTCPNAATWGCSENTAGTIVFVSGFFPSGGLPDFSGEVVFDLTAADTGVVYPLDVQAELYNTQGGPAVPNGTDPGSILIVGPDYSSNPAPGPISLGSVQTGGTNPSTTLDITNVGGAGTGLDVTCTEPSSAFITTNGSVVGLPQNATHQVGIACNAALAPDTYNTTLSCTHNGDGTTESSPAEYQLSCEVTPGPQPNFASTPAPGAINMGPVPEGDASAPTQNISISNNGDPGTTLTGTCGLSGDSEISLTSDGSFNVAQGGTADVETLSCSTAAEGSYTSTLTCNHNGTNTPSVFNVSCDIGPPPAPEYSSAPGIGSTLDFGGTPTEQGDPDPTDSILISNSGEANSLLDVTCTDSSDPDGVFTVTGGNITGLETTDPAAMVTVTCDASAEGNYSGTLSCDHNGETATDPATYPLSCVISPPGAAVFASTPNPGTDTDMTPGADPAEGEPDPTSQLTFFNNAEAGDQDLNIACSITGDAEITVAPDISGGIAIAPEGQSAVTFTCDTTTAGDYSVNYSCDYTVDGTSLPTGGGSVLSAVYDYSCDVRPAEADVDVSPPSGTTIERLVEPGGSADYEIVFSEIMDEGVDGEISDCTLVTNTDFQIISPTFPATVPAGGQTTVLVRGTDPGGVESSSDTLNCTYTDSANPGGVDVSYNLVMLIGGNASFLVTKDFTDDNPSEVTVELSCNTGLPLEQTKVITEDNGGVKFIIDDFDSGEMDCTVSEISVPAGYTASYDSNGSQSSSVDDENGCHFTAVGGGDENFCSVTNTPDPVDVVITKEWIMEGPAGDFVDTDYRLTLYCDAEIVGGQHLYDSLQTTESPDLIPVGCGQIIAKQEGADIIPINFHDWCKVFDGDGPEVFTAEVIPEYPDSNCYVVETVYDDAVEVDNGCEDLTVSAGVGASCTVTNTVFYEGIPTLSQYGMALLALLMLGVGLVSFRRYS